MADRADTDINPRSPSAARRTTAPRISAEWAGVALAFMANIITFWVALDQHNAAEKMLQEQHSATEKTLQEQRELIRVQIAGELEKEFDSAEMLRARRRLASQLLNGKFPEYRVLDFFEKVGMYLKQGRVDEDTVYEDSSYHLEYYWLTSEASVKRMRAEEHDNTLYDRF